MEKIIKDFEITLLNKSTAKVHYVGYWSALEWLGNDGEQVRHRTDHFEFRDNLYISETGYRSHFINPDWDYEVFPEEVAENIANEIADFKRDVVSLKTKQLGLGF